MSVLPPEINPPHQPSRFSRKEKTVTDNSILIIRELERAFLQKPEGFHQFFQPCKDPLYQAGQSWLELLGFPRRVFNEGFDFIGVRHRSKSAFRKARDKFQGKFYASYYERRARLIYFVRKHTFADLYFRYCFTGKSATFSQQAKSPSDNRQRSQSPDCVEHLLTPAQLCRRWNIMPSTLGLLIECDLAQLISKLDPIISMTSKRLSDLNSTSGFPPSGHEQSKGGGQQYIC